MSLFKINKRKSFRHGVKIKKIIITNMKKIIKNPIPVPKIVKQLKILKYKI
jgi:hypothetical protein